MKAALAYFQGKFNSCNFEWQSATRCKITLIDDVNQLQGDFIAVFDDKRTMVDVKSDAGMRSIKASGPAVLEPPAELPGGGP